MVIFTSPDACPNDCLQHCSVSDGLLGLTRPGKTPGSSPHLLRHHSSHANLGAILHSSSLSCAFHQEGVWLAAQRAGVARAEGRSLWFLQPPLPLCSCLAQAHSVLHLDRPCCHPGASFMQQPRQPSMFLGAPGYQAYLTYCPQLRELFHKPGPLGP
jgi:hypothetical protein